MQPLSNNVIYLNVKTFRHLISAGPVYRRNRLEYFWFIYSSKITKQQKKKRILELSLRELKIYQTSNSRIFPIYACGTHCVVHIFFIHLKSLNSFSTGIKCIKFLTDEEYVTHMKYGFKLFSSSFFFL